MRHMLRIGWLTTLLGVMVLGGERPATQSAEDPPAAWKQQFGLDAMSAIDASAGGDPDVDGLTNAAEYAANTHPRGFFNRYFAEGATGAFFDVSFALFNAGDQPANTLLRFLRSDGIVVPHYLHIPARARLTINAADIVALADVAFSTTVESDGPVVVDRTMRWNPQHYGSHSETGTPTPAPIWYLAEGATHNGFKLFYLLQNPNPVATTVEITYLRPDAAPIVKTYTVGANSRSNVWVNYEDPGLASTDVSATLVSTLPIVVERSMYRDVGGLTFAAGHASAGVTAPAHRWFLAEGATGPFFDLFVLIANPNADGATIEVDFLLPTGQTIKRYLWVNGYSRSTIWVDLEDAALANTAVSTVVRSANGIPVIVERAMWWPGTSDTWSEAHNSAGATKTARRWAVADGEVGGADAVETYVLLANTSAAPGTVKVTLYFEDGGAAEQIHGVAANSRFNVDVARMFPESANRRFATLVDAIDPIDLVVERAMYSNAAGVVWAAGTNASATAVAVGEGTSAPSNMVWIGPSSPNGSEAGQVSATVKVWRSGGNNPLAVTLSIAGTASGSDYAAVGPTVVIPAGSPSALVRIQPADDGELESPETVVVTLGAGSGYTLATPTSETVTIQDNDAPGVPATLSDGARFLTQATFGPTLASIADIQSLGYNAWIDAQLNAPRSSFVAYLDAIQPADDVPDEHVQESWFQYGTTRPDQLRQRVANALLEIMVVSEANGLEPATYEFATYMDLLMVYAFSNYRTILEQVTLSPTMGKFLDMLHNEKENPETGRIPNENYAREVLQLFSIGVNKLNIDGTPMLDAQNDPIPSFGQAEVEGFAKVFTGWTFYQATPPFRFRSAPEDWRHPMMALPNRHSPGTKLLLNGVTLPAGQTPEKDLQDALNNIFMHPNVGPFMAKQLIQRLVSSNPSPAYVARVASVFNDNGSGVRGDMKAVIKAVLLDSEARDVAVSRQPAYGKQKEPMIRFVSVLRAFGGRAETGIYSVWHLERAMGQAPFRAPSVFNFFQPDYRQPGRIMDAGLVSPEFQITNEVSVVQAANAMDHLISEGYTDYYYDGNVIKLDLTAESALTNTPDALLDRLNLLLCAGGMSAELRTIVKDAVTAIPSNRPNRRARAAVHLIVNSPEFVVQK